MRNSLGRFGGVLFGGVFFCAGLFAAYATAGSMTYQYLTTQDWVEVPAQIKRLELKQNHGDGTTYSVTAQYQYSVNGQLFTGSQVSLSLGSDNIGSYWQDLYQRLKQQKEANQSFAIINPAQPAAGVLDRTLRWEQIAFALVFVLMFCGAGLALIWFSLKPKVAAEQKLANAQKLGISSDEKHSYKFLLWFGVVFMLVGGLPAIGVLPAAIEKQEYGALALLLLFFVIGLAIIIGALRQRSAYKTIGATPLFLDPLPAIVGGQLGGYFEVGAMVWHEPLQVTLSCLIRRKSGDDTTTSIRWQKSLTSYCQQTASGMQVSFIFDCPDDLPASREWHNRSAIEWQVSVEGLLKMNAQAKQFKRTWEVPVELGEATTSQIDIPRAYLAKQQALTEQAARVRATQEIPLQMNKGLLEIVSAAGRSVGSALLGLLVGAIFTGIGLYTVADDWWPGYIFMMFGVVIIPSSIFLLGRKIEVKIDTQLRLVYMRRSWFGIPLYKRQAALYNPEQFTVKRSSSTTRGNKRTENFAVYMSNEGAKFLVAEGIEGRDTVNALRDKIIEESFPQRFE